MKPFNRSHFSKTLLGLAMLGLATSSPLYATPKPESDINPATADLEPREHHFFDQVYLAPDARLGATSRVFIEQPSAAFSRNWLREHRSDVSHRYKETTLERYAGELREQLSQAIEKSGRYTLTSDRASADVVIRPALVDLNIFAPDDRLGKSYVHTAGNAAIELEVWQQAGAHQESKMIASYRDHRQTRYHDFVRPVLANRATNHRDFERLMSRWSEEISTELVALSME